MGRKKAVNMSPRFKRKMIPVKEYSLHKRLLFLAGVMGAQTGKETSMEEVVAAGVTLLEQQLGVSMESINVN